LSISPRKFKIMKQIFLFLTVGAALVSKAQNVGIGTITPGYPLTVTAANSTTVISATNNDAGNSAAIYGMTSSGASGTTTSGATGLLGEATATNGGYFSAGIRGISRSTTGYGAGVVGFHAGTGYGVYGESAAGTGIVGSATSGSGGTFYSSTGSAVNGVTYGSVPVFQATNSNANNTAVIYAGGSATVNGNSTSGASAVVGELTATSGGYFSAGLRGINRSTTGNGAGVIGYHAGTGYGVYGESAAGTGVVGSTTSGSGGTFYSSTGSAVNGVTYGSVPVFQATNSNAINPAVIYAVGNATNSGSTANGASAVVGELTATSGGSYSAGLRGINRSTTGNGMGVVGYEAGTGTGVYGETPAGYGVYGFSPAGSGGSFVSSTGTGILSNSTSGIAVSAANTGTLSTIYALNNNTGNANGTIYAGSSSTVVSGAAANGGTAVVGEMTAGSGGYFSAGVRGINRSTTGSGMGVVGYQAGTGIGVYGETASAGMGVSGYSPNGQGGNFGANSGTALVASSVGGIGGNFSSTSGSTVLLANSLSSGDIAVFQANSGNVARIDHAGKGFFNGGTQTGGADVAEAFAVEGNRNDYEPGDVLVVSTISDRTVAKSISPYSTLVVGVYATKPGVLLTERMEAETQTDLVPMGVVGVIPTKVCSENGSIHRGDMLVTSSIPGHAMKATQAQIQFGSVIGKALEDFTTPGNGLIKVLVNVK
jgi:hypothetical protein